MDVVAPSNTHETAPAKVMVADPVVPAPDEVTPKIPFVSEVVAMIAVPAVALVNVLTVVPVVPAFVRVKLVDPPPPPEQAKLAQTPPEDPRHDPPVTMGNRASTPALSYRMSWLVVSGVAPMGNDVAFVRTSVEGVPRFGVVNTGDAVKASTVPVPLVV